MASANKLTLFIVIFMLLGILSGAAIHAYAGQTTITAWSENITLLTDVFLRLIKMVIAPLVFSTLTVGIMRLGETATIGRVGGKAMVWFITSSILHSGRAGDCYPRASRRRFEPGDPERVRGYRAGGERDEPERLSTHTIPTSITEAMSNNEILQIVVFSMFFGIAGASLGEIQRPAGGGAERGFPYYAEGDRVRDVRRAAGDFRRDLFGYRLAGAGDPA